MGLDIPTFVEGEERRLQGYADGGTTLPEEASVGTIPSARSAERTEGGPNVLHERRRLLRRRKVPA